jgi:ferredoxin, 2Fe-2S
MDEVSLSMAKITFIGVDGNETEITAENDVSLMVSAINNGIDGIVAECGGACSCATCHVIVDPEWYVKLPDPQNLEKDMLEFVAEPSDTSRLSCQINVTDELDGMVVTVPSAQY